MIVKHKLKQQVVKIMEQNHRSTAGFSYTVPSPDSYPYQWFWDSCFHAIILSHFDINAAKKELRSLAHWQFRNGMIPHMIYWQHVETTSFPKIKWGKRHTSSLIQPPLLAYAVWRIYEVDQDKSFLKEMLPVVRKLHRFLLRQRDPRRHSLIGIVNPDESGEDNSPRFDTALSLPARQKYVANKDANYLRRMSLVEQFRRAGFTVKGRMDRKHWVRDVPMNAILVNDLEHEARISQVLKDLHGARLAFGQAQNVKTAMRTHMLDGDLMWSTLGLDYKPIKIKTWAIFTPLFAGALTHHEAVRLVKKHLKNDTEFATPYSVPTVALDERSYNPIGFWRGPVWIATNWFIYQGLKNYGFDAEAAKIAKHSLRLLERSGFREQYHPITGDGMGATNFTWSGLILDMLS